MTGARAVTFVATASPGNGKREMCYLTGRRNRRGVAASASQVQSVSLEIADIDTRLCVLTGAVARRHRAALAWT